MTQIKQKITQMLKDDYTDKCKIKIFLQKK